MARDQPQLQDRAGGWMKFLLLIHVDLPNFIILFFLPLTGDALFHYLLSSYIPSIEKSHTRKTERKSRAIRGTGR